MGNGLPIDIETFRRLNTTDAKLDALFDVLIHMNSAGYECAYDRDRRLAHCEERFKILENRKNFDTGLAGIMGLLGGGVVWIVKWVAGR